MVLVCTVDSRLHGYQLLLAGYVGDRYVARVFDVVLIWQSKAHTLLITSSRRACRQLVRCLQASVLVLWCKVPRALPCIAPAM